MKLNNSTVWPDYFLRRMVAWCRVQIGGIPARRIRRFDFRKSRSVWGGCCYNGTGRLTVCVGKPEHFPATADSHEVGLVYADPVECLVAVTAHELYHLCAELNGERTRRGRESGGSSERVTCRAQVRVLETFREQRAALLSAWWAAPAAKLRLVRPPSDVRAEAAAAGLARWQSKAKLAQTKIRKYKAKVRYYERRKAATPSK